MVCVVGIIPFMLLRKNERGFRNTTVPRADILMYWSKPQVFSVPVNSLLLEQRP
jgi:hypothetical protein